MEEERRERGEAGGRDCGNSCSDSCLHIYECVFVCQVRANCHLVPAAQTSVTALLTQLVTINYLEKEARGPERPTW